MNKKCFRVMFSLLLSLAFCVGIPVSASAVGNTAEMAVNLKAMEIKIGAQTEDCVIYEGNNLQLIVAMETAGTYDYVWEVSADGGTTWTSFSSGTELITDPAVGRIKYSLKDAQPNSPPEAPWLYRVTVTAPNTAKAIGIIRVTVKEAINYTITHGAKQTVFVGNAASFVSNADFSRFVKVQVDDKDLDAANYTVEEDAAKITLKSSFIKTLSVGRHTLKIVFTDGSAATYFTVKIFTGGIPSTGDDNSILPWAILMAASAAGLIAVFKKDERKGKEQI